MPTVSNANYKFCVLCDEPGSRALMLAASRSNQPRLNGDILLHKPLTRVRIRVRICIVSTTETQLANQSRDVVNMGLHDEK